jgi:OmpA-OmpF porin, OOP family
MKRVLQGATALAAVMAAAPAFATEGWYGRVDAGYALDGNLESVRSSVTVPAFETRSLDQDWLGTGAIGYAFDNGFRLEGELGYRYNDIEIQPANVNGRGGNAHAGSAMINGIFDFNRGGGIEPYVGLGVGLGRVYAHSNNTPGTPAAFQGFDDSDTGLAWQAMAGLGLAVSEQLTIDVGYRYFAVPNLEFVGRVGTSTPRSYEADYDNQAVTVGLRWQFAPPAPPPTPMEVLPPPPPPPVVVAPPAPPPVQVAPPRVACPTNQFKVYFEWDRATLNQAARDTIQNAVSQARRCNLGGVVVVGHTDTSGSPRYNARLSERRASVVAQALVAGGINGGAISTSAAGETQLDKATRDGVREPLNRRTEVTITFVP